MIRAFVINKYIAKEFLKYNYYCILCIFCLVFVFNLFEEINFFKDYDVGLYMPLFMSALFVPIMVYNMFPFIILLSGIWFFLKIKKTDEIIAMKSLDVKFIYNYNYWIVSLVLGVFFVTAINPLTSALVKKYESIQELI